MLLVLKRLKFKINSNEIIEIVAIHGEYGLTDLPFSAIRSKDSEVRKLAFDFAFPSRL